MHCKLWAVLCELLAVLCELWTVLCELWPVLCELWAVLCELWPVFCGAVSCVMWAVSCVIWVVSCALWVVELYSGATWMLSPTASGHLEAEMPSEFPGWDWLSSYLGWWEEVGRSGVCWRERCAELTQSACSPMQRAGQGACSPESWIWEPALLHEVPCSSS